MYLEQLMHMDWMRLSELLLLPACILTAAFTFGVMLNRVLTQKIDRTLKAEEGSIKSIFLHALRGIPINFCLMSGLYWIVNTSQLPDGLARIFSYILFTVIVFTLTRVFERALSGIINVKLSGTGDATSSTLLNTILKTAVYASGVLIILQYYGISVAPILTAMGVGGMAVALGLQETLANIFAGLQLILSKQVRINDYIKLSSGEEGRVTDITWRLTTIMPPSEGNVVVIPNKNIAGAITTNYSRPRNDIIVTVPIGVGYESDLDHVERVTMEVALEVQKRVDGYEELLDINGIDRNPLKPAVRFHTFGDSSIDFNVFLHAHQFDVQYLMKHEFIKGITRRYREEGINIPFPIRTIVKGDE